MRKNEWKKWLMAMTSGSLMLQVSGCAETAAVTTTVFSGVTAGGVFYLIWRILRD